MNRDVLGETIVEADELQARVRELAAELHTAREKAAPRLAGAVSAELAGLGMGGGEFRVIVA